MSRRDRTPELSAELLLRAYAAGIFPMSESRDDPHVFWVDPEVRGVLPLDRFHVSRRLRKTVRRGLYRVSCDGAFSEVVGSCAESTTGRRETWINPAIERAVLELHDMGFAHSVEAWDEDRLVGGLYGVALGGAFFGESMFSRARDASKVALVHLVARLRFGGFRLLDTQFVTDHLRQFGAIEIPARVYLERLDEALKFQSVFHADAKEADVAAVLEEVLKSSS